MLPNPNVEAKSQRVCLKEPLRYGLLSWKLDLDYFMQKYPWEVGWELGLAFRSTQLATQVPSLASKKCGHLDIHVIVGTPDLGPVWTDPKLVMMLMLMMGVLDKL